MVELTILQINYDPIINAFILALNNGEDLKITVDLARTEMFEKIPELNEEQVIRDLLKKIYDIRKNRCLEIEAIDKEVKNIDTELGKVIKALGNVTSKLEVMAYKAQIDAMGKQKVLLDTRRHLVKLSYQEQGELESLLLDVIQKRK